jgi:ribonuclease VapC
MAVDASALVAILEDEPEEEAFKRAISGATVRLLSPINLLEAHIIARRRGDVGVRRLDELIAHTGTQIVPVDATQAAAAREAFDRFGKGRHKAGLNLADCFAYALAKTRREPLLFKGGDFAATDVVVAA